MKGEIMFNNAHTIVISYYCIFTASNSPRLSVAFVFAAVAVFVPPRWIRGKHVRQRRGFTACTWFRSFERYCMLLYICMAVYHCFNITVLCGYRKYPYPPTEGFSSLTLHPTGFSVPEGSCYSPTPALYFHDFSTWSPIRLGNSKSKTRDLINLFWST